MSLCRGTARLISVIYNDSPPHMHGQRALGSHAAGWWDCKPYNPGRMEKRPNREPTVMSRRTRISSLELWR